MKKCIVLTVWMFSFAHLGVANQEGKEMVSEVVRKTVIENDVRLSATVPIECRAGESIELSLSLENIGTQGILYFSQSLYKDFTIKILDSESESVPLTLFGKKGIGVLPADQILHRLVTMTLAPGKQITASINLARLFDLTVAGTYTLHVTRQVNQRVPGDGGTTLTIEKFGFSVSEPHR